MAELNQKFHCKKGGVVEELSAYTTLKEVNNKGLNVKLGGQRAYLAFGDSSTAEASRLNCILNGEPGRILTNVSQGSFVTLICYDVSDSQQISSIKFPCSKGDIIYFTSDTAPKVQGYDFVMMDGIYKEVATGQEQFSLWYVKETVPNRTLTRWDNSQGVETGATANNLLLNTFSMTECYWMFQKVPYLTSLNRINTSKLTDASYMFYGCNSLKTVPEMDTSHIAYMTGMFYYTGINIIIWDIDMRSCVACNNMFTQAELTTEVSLKNVPRDLSLTGIGTNMYRVINYI